MKHIAAEALVQNSILRVRPSAAEIPSHGGEQHLPAKLGRVFLTPDDISQIETRYDQQSLGSAWYGFSLIGLPPARVIAVIAFTSFGDRNHLMIARLEDGTYAAASDNETILATCDHLGKILDLFDERAYQG